jgi:hypothetical protein
LKAFLILILNFFDYVNDFFLLNLSVANIDAKINYIEVSEVTFLFVLRKLKR